ncbi:hypothetical protein [Paenibacillus glacialis]|uniref:Uncharacterized protein n=1 Tax=Paenibacillus glacialis TaxID=494026 RepID=A0A162PKV3_9BACL|nr:hypothetical protein [Paenibacillus glacialis]OAB33010.1 hypothetical protein PGLA_26385 [Paenibacillus glacialis]
MGLSMKKIRKAASKVVNKVDEAAAAAERAVREEAARAAEAAANEVKRAAEEIARQAAAAELKKQAEALAEQAKRVEEELKNQAIEAAQKAAAELNKQAENLVKDQIKSALGEVVSNINDLSEQGQLFVKQIESEIQNLIELANIDALKRKLLEKAEQLSEEYLKNKIEPIAQAITLTSVPDVKLDLSTTSIKIEVFVYFLLNETDASDPLTNAIAVLTTDLEQEITKLEAPQVDVQFNFNSNKLENKIIDMIKEKIDKEKDKLIQGFLKSFFSDYFAVFDKIINLIPK